MEIMWASPERFSLAERYDAAIKAVSAEVPWETRMRSILQFSPQEVERMRAERAVDALLTPELPNEPNPVGAVQTADSGLPQPN
jgi:hypothetical protein